MLAADASAPTTVSDPAEAIDVHVADSLAALEVEQLREARAIADIGSGAGFPGIALAIALPQARVDLIESSGRKAAFIEGLAARVGLENTSVVATRAEEWAHGEGAERYAAVTGRAVAPLATLVEYAAPLLSVGGLLVAWKGRRDPGEELAGANAAGLVGMSAAGVDAVRPYRGSRNRHLHRYEKVAPTPPGFPRRPGIAKKRPLGA